MYYIIVNDAQQGPFTKEQLLAHGLTLDSMVWREGMMDWQRAAEVPELVALLTAPAPDPVSPPQPPRPQFAQPQAEIPQYLYHVIVNGQQRGPYNVAAFPSLGVTRQTMVWREGLTDWVAAGTLPELNAYFAGQQTTPYGQPYRQPAQPYGTYPSGVQPTFHTNWMTWAIVATVVGALFSCIGMIFGIIAINKASQANKYYEIGDTVSGDAANASARTNCIVAFVVAGIGLIFNIVYLGILGQTLYSL